MAPCPYRALVQHVGFIKQFFGDPLGTFPLFPNGSGEVASKEHVVQSIEVVMEKLGLEIRGPFGNRLFGGHFCRVAWARFMAEIGIDRLAILVGSWRSDAVLRCATDVPSTLSPSGSSRSSGPPTWRISPSRSTTLTRSRTSWLV